MKTLSHEAQSHVQWNCTYHIVVVPKYRKSILFQGIRKEIGFLFKELSKRFDFEIIKGNVGPDHIHIIAKIAPKYSIADTMGKLKGKSAIIIHNKFGNKKMISQKSFWSRGYFVSTVGIDIDLIKKYVDEQWKRDKYTDGNQLDFNG